MYAMRKFILYFLLILLILSVGTFSYGIYNGKKIQSFAKKASDIRAGHNFKSQIQEIENSFRDSGKKDVAAIREDTARLGEKLEEIVREAETAKKESEELSAPGVARETQNMMAEYFSKAGRQAADLKGIVSFMGEIVEVASVFGEISESANLEEMTNMIGKAKEKSAEMKTGNLPQDIEVNGKNLKYSMDAFLVKMEEMASLKSQDSAQLDAAYADFSKNEEEFFTVSKKHIDDMENLGIIEKKIDSEIMRLGEIRFSLK
ncbi:MAG: hypothetical protein A3J76_00665 [Candidatus Moranbacteria bacterium RBG_13_45_13]|nr:MAG: hypothetical protein A3J76_00665 [Candidatus Moranbacteria bacterium RBG_13_45_13]